MSGGSFDYFYSRAPGDIARIASDLEDMASRCANPGEWGGPTDVDRDELAAVASLRMLCDPAVAFFVADRPDVRERFERRGWTCVDVVPGDAPSIAWQRAGIRAGNASQAVRRG